MGKASRELTALDVRRIERRGMNFVGGVAGLGLNVGPSGSKSWILRAVIGGKRRDVGLGGYPSVSLAQAREDARAARSKVSQGVDPIEAKKQAKSALIAARLSAVTFAKAAQEYIAAHETSWRNIKHAQQWQNTIAAYANPVIGGMLVRDIELSHVLKILEPLWRVKTETAVRLRSRIEIVLDFASARGLRSGLNPARWRGHLDKLLPAPAKVATKKHHRALHFSKVPEFMEGLRGQAGIGAKALQFAILTAARSGEVRMATWDEFDLEAATWTVPSARMKAGREHRVPLSSSALALIEAQARGESNEYVFQAVGGRALSDMSLSAVLRRMKVDAVPHGFRSSFRDWCAEATDFPRDVAEMALAHAIGNKVEAAYRRGDLFEKRRQMMQDWARYVLN